MGGFEKFDGCPGNLMDGLEIFGGYPGDISLVSSIYLMSFLDVFVGFP